jgi:hypothetical protein
MITSRDQRAISLRCRQVSAYEHFMLMGWANYVMTGGKPGFISSIFVDEVGMVELFYLYLGHPMNGWIYMKSENGKEAEELHGAYRRTFRQPGTKIMKG